METRNEIDLSGNLILAENDRLPPIQCDLNLFFTTINRLPSIQRVFYVPSLTDMSNLFLRAPDLLAHCLLPARIYRIKLVDVDILVLLKG